LGSEQAFCGRHVCTAQAPRQSANARLWHPEIQEVNRDGPARPINLSDSINRKCDIPFETCSRVRDIKKNLAHVSVFGSNAPNEPDLVRSSFVRGIPQSGRSGLKIFAWLGSDPNDAPPLASSCLCKPSTRREDRASAVSPTFCIRDCYPDELLQQCIPTSLAITWRTSLKTPAGIPARATDPGILEETAPRPRS